MHAFDYSKPTSVSEAIRTMTALGTDKSRFLAGGTTLVDLMKLNVETPEHIIDITGIRELQGFDVSGTKELTFGALAHMSDIASHPFMRRNYAALSEALWRAASQQLRNMATIGGNLLQRTRCAYFRSTVYPCNKRTPGSGCAALEGLNRGHAILGVSDACIAVYPGDLAVALVAFDAVVDTVSPRGTRSLPVTELHLEPRTTPNVETALAADELILRVRVPTTKLGKARRIRRSATGSRTPSRSLRRLRP